MTQLANRTATTARAQRRDIAFKTTQKASKSMTTNTLVENDGQPVAELTAEGFSVALHNDSQLGPIIVLDDLELYQVEGINDEAIRATMTPATWQRLRALVLGGVVDQALANLE